MRGGAPHPEVVERQRDPRRVEARPSSGCRHLLPVLTGRRDKRRRSGRPLFSPTGRRWRVAPDEGGEATRCRRTWPPHRLTAFGTSPRWGEEVFDDAPRLARRSGGVLQRPVIRLPAPLLALRLGSGRSSFETVHWIVSPSANGRGSLFSPAGRRWRVAPDEGERSHRTTAHLAPSSPHCVRHFSPPGRRGFRRRAAA